MLGSLSRDRVKNLSDLINTLKKKKKSNTGLLENRELKINVKAVFINVPISGAMEAINKTVNRMNDNDLLAGKRVCVNVQYIP